MAATIEADRLTEAHRLAQVRLGRATVAQLLAVWPLLDLADLDGTTARWLLAAIPIIGAARRLSAQVASNYLTTFRALELGVEAPAITPALASIPNAQALITSLAVTGPVAVKQALARGLGDVAALERGAASSAGAGMRHALNGGRDTIHHTVDGDRQALGFARVTSGHACAFCAMLASRGAVYKSESSALHAHGRRYHDRCACGVEPVYRRDGSVPANSQRYAEMWQQAKDAPGDTASEFRRLVEAAA